MADMTAVPLQHFIASLDGTCLPRILQVCCGVYFQGSVYEMSGCEVCFSTGDLIKVIGIELVSVCCEDIKTNEMFELPITHKGLLKVVPDEMSYNTIEEILSLRSSGLASCQPFTFISRSTITMSDFTICADTPLTVLSIERSEGQVHQVRCRVEGNKTASLNIPLSTQGEFIECPTEECFTLQEIMSSPGLRSRRFRFSNTIKCERTFVLSPVFQIKASMSNRKNEVKFLSSLDVDVIDVTDRGEDIKTVQELSLTEVFAHPDESFPLVVKILEGPEYKSYFKCNWIPQLYQNQHLVLHKKEHSAMVLLSCAKNKSQRYFLVLQQYNGQFRKRQREFHSVYELYVASLQIPRLTVTVTQSCEEDEEQGVPELSVGEQLVIGNYERIELPRDERSGRKNQSVEVLMCHRIQVPNDDEDDDDGEKAKREEEEKISLPLYLTVHFVEVHRDTKKYRLRDLGKKFSLPLDVKVVTRDTELESDPLFGLPCLRIEAAVLEQTILASFPQKLESCFSIFPQWLSFSVTLINDPLPWPPGQPPKCRRESVIEVTEKFFYNLLQLCKVDTAPPPPRPPKHMSLPSAASQKTSPKASKSTGKSKKYKQQADKRAPTQEFSFLSLTASYEGQAPPVRPPKHLEANIPNTKTDQTRRHASSDNSAPEDDSHDYECVDDEWPDEGWTGP